MSSLLQFPRLNGEYIELSKQVRFPIHSVDYYWIDSEKSALHLFSKTAKGDTYSAYFEVYPQDLARCAKILQDRGVKISESGNFWNRRNVTQRKDSNFIAYQLFNHGYVVKPDEVCSLNFRNICGELQRVEKTIPPKAPIQWVEEPYILGNFSIQLLMSMFYSIHHLKAANKGDPKTLLSFLEKRKACRNETDLGVLMKEIEILEEDLEIPEFNPELFIKNLIETMKATNDASYTAVIESLEMAGPLELDVCFELIQPYVNDTPLLDATCNAMSNTISFVQDWTTSLEEISRT